MVLKYVKMLKYKIQINLFVLDLCELGVLMCCVPYHHPTQQHISYLLEDGHQRWPKEGGGLQHLHCNKFV